MKTQAKKRKLGLAILTALFLLCIAVALVAAAPQTQLAFAESTEPAFRNCASLTSVTIPDSVTTIGNVVFEECSSLKTVYLPKNDKITVGEATFRSTTTLIVAANKEYYEMYKVMKNLAAHVPPTENGTKLTYETTVTFDSDGGIVGETTQTKLFGYPLNYEKNAETKVWAADEGYTLPSATKQNYIFKGWKTAVAEGEAVTATTV